MWQLGFFFIKKAKSPLHTASIKAKMSEVSPIFFLALELLLLTANFLTFLTRWYLSASILSDPAGPLGVPRRFLHRGQRKGKGLSHRRKAVLCLSIDKTLVTYGLAQSLSSYCSQCQAISAPDCLWTSPRHPHSRNRPVCSAWQLWSQKLFEWKERYTQGYRGVHVLSH